MLCHLATGYHEYCQPWGMSLLPLSRIVHSCQQPVSWNCEWSYYGVNNTTLPLTPLFLCGLPTLIMTSILILSLKAFENHKGQGEKIMTETPMKNWKIFIKPWGK